MAENQATVTQQDPWAVVSQTPAPQQAAAQPGSQPASPSQQDPWAVVSQTPAPAPQPQPDAYGGQGYQVIADALKKAAFGPNTALAQGATPDTQTETSGFSDIAHGSIRKGLGEIWKANAPHIIPGSPMEKMIQEFDPTFKGAATEEYQANHPTISSVGDHPLIDAGQFIDKKEHPVLKALTEVAQGLTSPNNIAILIGTGGMGLVSSPKALAVTNKLLSAGFSAQAIGGFYKNSEAFAKAYENGDANEALYQLTHAVANGTMGVIAGSHAVGKELPFASSTDKAIASKVASSVQGVSAPVAKVASNISNSIAGTFGISNDFDTVVRNISKPSAKNFTQYKAKIANVHDDLQAILNNSAKPIEDPKTFADAIDSHIKGHEQMLQQEAGATQTDSAPLSPDLTTRISKRLDQFFADNKGLFPDEAVGEAKRKLLERILQSRNGEHMLQPNLFEAENVRRGLNDEGKTAFDIGTGKAMPKNAYQAGALEVADELRGAIDESFDKRGVKGVQEWRSKEKDLINVRDQIDKAQKRAEERGEPTLWKAVTDKVGLPSAVAAIAFGTVGHPLALAAGGLGILSHYLTEKGANPISNVQRAADIASKNTGATATEPSRVPTANPNPNPPSTPPAMGPGFGTIGPSTGPVGGPAPAATAAPVPVNHGLYAALATHYGETLGKTPYADLEGRFLLDLKEKTEKGVPLQPAEKALLGKVNQHYADQQVKSEEAAQKLAEEQRAKAKETEDKNKEKSEAGLITAQHPPFETQDHIPVPARFARAGYTPQRVGAHELAHQIMVDEYGHGTGDIINHNHSQIDSGSLAEARFEKGQFQDEEGKLKPEKLPEILAILHAGPVAEELLHNVPLHENASDDLDVARKILDEAGVAPAEAGMMMKAAEMKAREVLTSPGVSDIIKRYTEHREAGLDKDVHMSAETVGKAVQEVRHARGGGEKNGTTNNEARPGKEAKEVAAGNEPGGEGKPKGKSKKAVRPAGETGTGAGSAGEGSTGRNTEPEPGVKPGNGEEGAVGGPSEFNRLNPPLKLNEETGKYEPVKELKAQIAEREPKDIIEGQGLKYKGELVKGSDVHMFEHPDHPGMTAALQSPFTPEAVTDKMNSKLKAFGVGPKAKAETPAGESEMERLRRLGPEAGTPKEGPSTNLKANLKPTVDDYERHQEEQDRVGNNILNEYEAAIGKKGYRQKWDLVPAGRLKKIWNDYANTGVVRDEAGINKIANNVLENIHKIEVNNILTGHTSIKPEEWAENQTGEKYPDGYFDKNENFFDDEKGNWRLSDYAAEKLSAAAMNLRDAKTAEEKLPIIDHILNIAHQRSDLPSWFVEGGTKTLNELAGKEFKTNLRPDRVSTRIPTAKQTKTFTPEEHMGEEPLTIGRKAVDADPRIQQKFADIVSKYPGFKFKKGMSAAQILNSFTTQAKDNLLHLWDSVDPVKRIQNAKWYESVNKKANDDAKTHNILPRQAAGVYASLSPQKDWDMNASLAKRVMDVHFNHANETASPEMKAFGQGLADKARTESQKQIEAFRASGETDPKIVKRTEGAYQRKLKNANDLEAVVNKIAGTKYSDLTDSYEKGLWVRLYDEVNNPRNYPKIDPGTGNALEDVTNQDGSKSAVAWGSTEPIARAVSILQDGSRENISNQLGEEHKVRNFYNNIIDPSHPEDVTIDTHAVAAAHLQPYSGQSKEVTNNFGGAGKSAATGVHGTYPLYAEAYRQAAAERGVKAREMQSVTWERIRELFPSEIKDAAFQAQAKGIMQKMSDGEISIQEARQEVTDAAVAKRAQQIAAAKVKADAKAAKAAARAAKKGVDSIPKVGDNSSAGFAALGGGQ